MEEKAPELVYAYFKGRQIRLERGILDCLPDSNERFATVRLVGKLHVVLLLPMINKRGKASAVQHGVVSSEGLDFPLVARPLNLRLAPGEEIYLRRALNKRDEIDLAIRADTYDWLVEKTNTSPIPRLKKDHRWPDEAG